VRTESHGSAESLIADLWRETAGLPKQWGRLEGQFGRLSFGQFGANFILSSLPEPENIEQVVA
jgi:hypothetical protein